MTKKINIYLFSFFHLLGIGLLGYLTKQHINLKTGQFSGDSACNISATFNCDAVNASIYSEFLGIPISLWGALSLAVALALYLSAKIFSSQTSYIYAKLLTYFNLVVCLIYFAISLFLLHSYCLFCMGSYIAIAISAAILFFEPKNEESLRPFAAIKDLFQEQKFYLGAYASIPLLAFVINQAALGEAYFEAEKNAKFLVQSWQMSPEKSFPDLSSYQYGSEDPIMTIIEFADFNCIHCKNAAPVLHAFVDAYPDVQLKFYNFPLDGACNDAIQRAGASCEMAKAVFCAHQLSEKGWKVQEKMFQQERPLSRKESMDLVLNVTNIDKEELSSCASSDETEDTIRAQAKLGKDVGVRGTPSIFVNNKALQGGQTLPVLRAVYKDLKSH